MSYDYRFRLLMGLALVGSSAALGGCGDSGADCGAGTTEVSGVCIPNDMVCAEGTVFDMTTLTCVPDMPITCGAGTILDSATGMCVPSSTTTCGEGTVLLDGMCVPDTDALCGRNTIYDAEMGTCVPDPDALCEGDLVFVEASATCVDPDELLEGMADVRELGEINDPAFNEGAMPQVVDIADGTGSFYGCIEPQDFDDDGIVDADLDYFQISVDGPTLLNVRVDGIRGLSGAVAFFAIEENLLDAGWQRVIGSLSGVGDEGQVFLPQAGDYFVAASDTRSLLLADVVAGGPGQCYFVQLATEDLPDPTVIDDTPTTGTFGDPQFYTVASVATGDLIFSEMNELDLDGDATDNGNVAGTVVAVVNGRFLGQAAVQPQFDPFTGEITGVTPALVVANSLEAGDEVLIVVDSVFNVSFDDVDFNVNATKPVVQEMPTDGSALTFTQEIDPDTGIVPGWAYFNATEGDVVRLVVDQADGDDIDWAVFQPLGTGFGLSGSGFDEYIQVVATGIHYVRLFNNDRADAETFDVTFAQTDITPTELTLDTASAGDLSTESRGFFSIDLSTNDWIETELGSLTNMTDGDVRAYDRSVFGALDLSLGATDSETTDSSFERILLGEGLNVLITVEDADGHDMDETFDITVRDVPYTDLGAVDSMTPQSAMDVALAADGVSRFVVQGTVSGELVSVTASSTGLDLVLDILEIPTAEIDTTVDDGLDGDDEVFSTGVGSEGLTLAFRVSEFFGVAGMFDINVTAEPPPYSSAASAIAFTSICSSQGGSGTDIAFSSTDDSVSATLTLASGGAFPFQFFGTAVTDFVVSTNGWMTFSTPYTGSSFLPGSQGNIVAPFEVDLDMIEGCWQRNADTFTVEWRGQTWSSGDSIEFQVIFHTDNTIDFVYGPGHDATEGALDLVGLRNADTSIELPLSGMTAADTSFTWTPAP